MFTRKPQSSLNYSQEKWMGSACLLLRDVFLFALCLLFPAFTMLTSTIMIPLMGAQHPRTSTTCTQHLACFDLSF